MTATGSPKTATITALCLVLWKLLYVSATCTSPQYAEYGQQGVIKCNFTSGFTGIYWYLYAHSTYHKLIRLEKQEDGTLARFGYRYSNGKYDITLDGSLIISNITNYNNQTFKVVHVNEELHVDELYVELLTAVFPESRFPMINVCNKANLCVLENTDLSLLTCSYNKSRPPVDLVWYKQSHEGAYRLHGETMVAKDGDWTFSSLLTTNISNLINGPLISFSCRVVNPVLKTEVVESTVVFDTSHQSWYSQLERVESEMWFLINSEAKVPCNDQNKPLIFVWKKILGATTDSLMYVSVGNQSRITSGTWNISHDGTLVFPNIRLENEGVYTCMVFDGNRFVLNMVQVTVWAKPTPLSIFTDDCPQNEEPCEIFVREKNTPFNISCHLNEVYPNMTLALETDSDTEIIRRRMFSSRIGSVYNLTTTAEFSPLDCNAPIKVTCSLSVPVQLIRSKIISVRLEECEGTGTSAVLAVIVIIIVIIIGIICAILLYRFRYRFLREKVATKNPNPEAESLKDYSRENEKTEGALDPEAEPLNDHSAQNTEKTLDPEAEPLNDHSAQNTEKTLDSAEDSSHSELMNLAVERCKELADTLLLWPVYQKDEIFNKGAVNELEAINDKKKANQNDKEMPYESYLDKLHALRSTLVEGSSQTESRRNIKQQHVDQLQRTLSSYVQLQKDLFVFIASLALSYNIMRSVLKKSNFSDNKHFPTKLKDIDNILKAINREREDGQDLPTALSRVEKYNEKLLQMLQTLSPQGEGPANYHDRTKDKENVTFDDLLSAIETLIKERNVVTGGGINILHFVTTLYLQNFSQGDVEVTAVNIGECKGKIQANIAKIADGVNAASTELHAVGENVDVAFLGSMKLSAYMKKEQACKKNDTMIETMKRMNDITHIVKSSS